MHLKLLIFKATQKGYLSHLHNEDCQDFHDWSRNLSMNIHFNLVRVVLRAIQRGRNSFFGLIPLITWSRMLQDLSGKCISFNHLGP